MRTSVVTRSEFPAIFGLLSDRGFQTVGPTLRDGAIVYDVLASVDDLPIGWTDVQKPGGYEVVHREDEALFGYAVPADSWKRYLYPPRSDLVRIRRIDGSLVFTEQELDATRYAFFGVRACELAAISVQDGVFLESGFVDRTYRHNRSRCIIIAAGCGSPAATCFCASMGTGPMSDSGFDLAITEFVTPKRHEFLLEAGTPAGAELIEALEGRDPVVADFVMKDTIAAETEAAQTRTLPAADLQRLLPTRYESPRWHEIADRCLGCANCTLVCPTCFCSTVEDSSSFDEAWSARSRRWDSCFTMDFSSVHGSPVRATTASRYRQWLTHKLATWHDQFGTSGCVGCGRCITWCPVGIDITDEVHILVAEEAAI